MGAAASRASRALGRVLDKSLPEAYYVRPDDIKTPKAPSAVLRVSFVVELGMLFGAFGFFISYFASQGSPCCRCP